MTTAAESPRWDDRGSTDRDEVAVNLRPGAEHTLADRVAVILEAARLTKLNIFEPARRPPPTRRYRNNAGARVALTVHLAELLDKVTVPTSPRTLKGLPPFGYRVRSTDNSRGCIKAKRDYESEDDVFVLVPGSSADDRYLLAGWCYGWAILDGELSRSEVKSMTELPLPGSLKSRSQS